MVDFFNMGSNANYPSDAGIRLGLTSNAIGATFRPTVIMDVDLAISGTPGTTAIYQVQVMDAAGVWVACPDLKLNGDGAAARGQVSATVEGVAVRLNADNGTTPGTTTNTPRYYLGVRRKYLTSVGDYSG